MYFYNVIFLVLHTNGILAHIWLNPTKWNLCYIGEAFLTIYDAPIRQCVRECQVRSRCKAVNYWRVRRVCELLDDDNAPLRLQGSSRPCVGVAKQDMPQIDGCQSCGTDQVCDAENNSCHIKECSAPPIINNGVFVGNMLKVGNKRKLVCHEFYKPEPEIHQIECQSDGGWGIVPLCVPAVECPAPPSVDNAVAGAITGDLIPGTVATYSCLTGFTAPADNNNFQMTCQADGSWSAVNFACLKDCSTPPSVDYASVDSGDTLLGTVRNYTCWNLYVTASELNTFSTECTSTGAWTTPTASCLRDCGSPPSVSFASVAAGNTYEGSVRLYTCDANYYVKAGGTVSNATTQSVTCQSNGTWDVAFECVLPTCPSSVTLISGTSGIADAMITASSTYNNQFLAHYCKMTSNKAWATKTNNVNEWIQVQSNFDGSRLQGLNTGSSNLFELPFDLSSSKIITSITTQGSNGLKADEWVKSYNILYSNTGCSGFTTMDQTFTGNNDISTLKTNTFTTPVLASCIRVNPQTWNSWITMRIEIYGC